MSKETKEPSQSPNTLGAHATRRDSESCGSVRLSVVGIGASAGGLESIERFFENVDATTGAAFVVIQHLSPDCKSFLPEILSSKTRLKVVTATDNLEVQANVVYLMPPRMNLAIENNVLRLTDIELARIPNKPIDRFFDSLASSVGDKAVAVVLSGTGNDGANGVRKVSAAGGRVFVESSDSAKFNDMPAAAIAQNVHEKEGTPFELAGAIFDRHAEPVQRSTLSLNKELDGDIERVQIFKAVESRYGVDFSRYKMATVNRRIDRRMTELGLGDLIEYWSYIQDNEVELSTLYYDMLIGVTHFFRDPEAFERLKEDIKRIIDIKQPGSDVRVWSAGCASGEEAYTLAMLFSDEIKRSEKSLHLKVFATDVDDESLGRASAGLYREDQMSNVPAFYMAKFFVDKNDRYKVNSALRSHVVFARHNVISDPPFSKLDMIACRNLLIYFDHATQQQVLGSFHFCLNSYGTLFLGPSESLGKFDIGYKTTDSQWKIFSKSDHSHFSAERAHDRANTRRTFFDGVTSTRLAGSFRDPSESTEFDDAYQALLEQYVPTGLLIDHTQELVHVYGEPPFELAFKPGKVSRNLRSFFDESLCTAISVCIRRASQERVPVEYANVTMTDRGKHRHVDVEVAPVVSAKGKPVAYFLVTFHAHSQRTVDEDPATLSVGPPSSLEHVSALERELSNVKQHLSATMEELELTNEELQSTSEELLAANEELQSTHEELHSVNQELYTVNAEYHAKIAELKRQSTDEDPLLLNTGVATLYIDRDRRILAFTTTAAEQFNLRSHDQGQTIDQVTHLFEETDFNQLVDQSIRTQALVETEVGLRTNEPHLVKIAPYINRRDELEGAVVSMISMQTVKYAEQKYKDLLRHLPVGIVGLSDDQKIQSLNPSLRHLLGVKGAELIGEPLTRLFPESRVHQVSQVVRSATLGDASSDAFKQVASTVVDRDGKELSVEISANSVSVGTDRLIHLYVTDMEKRQRYVDTIESHRDYLEKLVAERTAELENRTEEYEDLYENAPDMYASVSNTDATIIKCNNRLVQKTGYSKSELLGMPVSNLYHPDNRGEATDVFDQCVETGSVKARPMQLRSKTGELIPVLNNVDAVVDDAGRVVQSRSTWVDISDVHALKRENRTFLLATQGSEIGIWDWNFDNGQQVWSEKFHELLGYPAGSSHELSFDKSNIVHPMDRAELTDLFRRHFAGKSDFDMEVRLRTFSGDFRWYRLQGKATRSKSGKVRRMVGSAQDVHNARVAQDELTSQAEIYSFITQETNDGWWDWHIQTGYQYMSPRFWETFGYGPEDRSRIPIDWQDLVHPDDLQTAEDNFDKHCRTGGEHPYLQEVRYQHSDGHWVTVLCRGRVIEWNKNGEPVRMVGVHTDVSMLKHQEVLLTEINAQLAKSNEDLEQFAYITSHDLKAPLRGITTLVSFMEEDLKDILDDDREDTRCIRNNLQRLSRQATRMEGLISGVLDYSRVDSAGASLEDIDVRELLLDIAIDHSLEVGRQLTLPDTLPILRTDAIMFEQVLGNLISNAVKFHGDKNALEIAIDCKRDDNVYTFSVSDNGPGIKPDFHRRIFDMFQTLHSKDTYESSGIGLTLVKRIVKKFGGEVTVESDEGLGATFSFTWPVTTQDPLV